MSMDQIKMKVCDDAAQQNLENALREIDAMTESSGVISGRGTGGYIGSVPPVPEPNAASTAIATAGYDDGVFRELKEAIGKLSKKLDESIPVYTSIYGREGIETIKNKFKQQQRGAGIGGR